MVPTHDACPPHSRRGSVKSRSCPDLRQRLEDLGLLLLRVERVIDWRILTATSLTGTPPGRCEAGAAGRRRKGPSRGRKPFDVSADSRSASLQKKFPRLTSRDYPHLPIRRGVAHPPLD